MAILRDIQIYQEIFVLLFTTSFFLFAILRSQYYKYAKLLVLGAVSQRYANQFLREDNFFTERVNLITFLLIILNFTLFISKILEYHLVSKIFLSLLYILAYYTVKFVLIKFLSFSFKLKEISKLILFFTLMFDRVLAIVMFPLLIFMYFFYIDTYDFLIWTTYILISTLVFLKSICFINLGYKSFGISKFYIFLYLCVLEFFPIMILAKTVLF
tara:strand:+ start:67 stop:708 length:642 start_codon:yes stop_codon:yes gene_type:complete